MTGEIYGIEVLTDNRHPVVIVSKAWGILGEYATIAMAKDAIKTIKIPAKPWQINYGYTPKDAKIFYYEKKFNVWLEVD